MGNILDYIDWRGDIPFSCDSFNEVDGLVLAQLCYVAFDQIAVEAATDHITLRDAYNRFNAEKIPETERMSTFEQDILLFKKLAESTRFGQTILADYVNMTDTGEELQFSAVSCYLADGSVFVAFRGTDVTVVGWKEDFNLSYMAQTSGQLNAVNYLNEKFSGYPAPIRLGGHSKGGNLAIYAAAYCSDEVRGKITEVYAYDSPGFRQEIVESPQYKEILPRLNSFVPEGSIVGMLLASEGDYKIVRSSATGISQHITYSWELKRNHFLLADKLTRSGDVINKTITGWLDEFSDEDRQIFVNTLFEILEAADKPTLKELKTPSSYASIIKAMRSLTPEQQRVMREARKKIADNGKKALFPNSDK